MEFKDSNRQPDFSGTPLGHFDWMGQAGDTIERVPGPLFALFLVLLAFGAMRGDVSQTGGLLLFFGTDWLMLIALPRAGKSYGPSKPATLLLAFLRLVPAVLLPVPWAWIVQGFGTVLAIYGFWIEPHKVQLTRQTLESPKLLAGPPLRLVHFGDLHVERVTGRERQLVAMVKSLNPDVILFSGDFLSYSNVNDPIAWEHCRSVLSQLSAPLGVYAVTGSPPVDPPEVIAKLLEGLSIRWLKDEMVTLDDHGQPIDLIGITCTHRPSVDAPRLQQVLGGIPKRFTILLYHTPDLAPEAASAGIDLQLSGHTHGGQVRLPFFGAIVTSSLYWKRMEVGRMQIGNLTLYVTRGLGMEGKGAPRVRFLSPPEVILWEIGAVVK